MERTNIDPTNSSTMTLFVKMMYPAFDMNADAIISISKHMLTKDYMDSLPPIMMETERTLAERTLAERTLAERTLAERTLAERTLAERTLAERTLAEITKPPSSLPSADIPAPIISAKIPIQKRIPEQKSDLFTPKQENTLFWCMFVAHHGFLEYTLIGTRYTNAEIDEKQTMAAFLVKNPSVLKSTNYKVSNQTVQSLCSHLTICRRDGLLSIIAFAAYYKKHVYVVFPNKTYLAFSFQKELANDNAVILHCKTVGKHDNQIYTLDLETTEEKVQQIRDTMFMLEHYEKPLHAASGYKVDELTAIATLLGISMEKKMKKTELYEAVAQHCSLEKIKTGV